MRLRTLAFAGITATLSACIESPPPSVSNPDDRDACGANGMQAFLGQNINDVDVTGHDPLRIIPPGTAVTMDFRADRLNIEVDEGGIVTRVYCG